MAIAKTNRQLTLVQRVIGVWLQEQVLQADHNGVEIEDRFPVFSEDVQANIAFQVDVRVIDLHVKNCEPPNDKAAGGGWVPWGYI